MKVLKFLMASSVMACSAIAFAGHTRVATEPCCEPVAPVARMQTVTETIMVPQVQTRTRQVPRIVEEIQTVQKTRMVPETYTEEITVQRTEYDTEEYQVQVCVPQQQTRQVCVPDTQSYGVESRSMSTCANGQCERAVSNAELMTWYGKRAVGDMEHSEKFKPRHKFLARRALSKAARKVRTPH